MGTKALGELATWFHHLSRASQTLTVPSSLAEAICRPSGLKATQLTALVCPLSVSVSSPVPASQTLTVLSSLAEAWRRPSRLNATPSTDLVCPLSVRISWPMPASQTFPVGCAVALDRHVDR